MNDERYHRSLAWWFGWLAAGSVILTSLYLLHLSDPCAPASFYRAVQGRVFGLVGISQVFLTVYLMVSCSHHCRKAHEAWLDLRDRRSAQR